MNQDIDTVPIIRDKGKHIWTYRSRTWAEKAIEEWGSLAQMVHHPYMSFSRVRRNANTLWRYRCWILSLYVFSIHPGRLERVNNKSEIIKRKPHGFPDLGYFPLKIIQAFTT